MLTKRCLVTAWKFERLGSVLEPGKDRINTIWLNMLRKMNEVYLLLFRYLRYLTHSLPDGYADIQPQSSTGPGIRRLSIFAPSLLMQEAEVQTLIASIRGCGEIVLPLFLRSVSVWSRKRGYCFLGSHWLQDGAQTFVMASQRAARLLQGDRHQYVPRYSLDEETSERLSSGSILTCSSTHKRSSFPP